MLKKILCWCLLILFIIPLPAMASLSDDVAQFEEKYSEIYDNIDPAIAAKMEPYLQDVVDYVVTNYDESKDINVQIKNAVGSVLLTGEEYKNDLLPFMLEQAGNQAVYSAQLSEMKAIVRKEVEARLNPSTPPAGGGGGGIPTAPSAVTAATTEVARQLAAGNAVISLAPEKDTDPVQITGAVLSAITTAGKELEITASGVTFRLPPQALDLPAESIVAISAQPLNETQITEVAKKLSSDQKLVGSVYEFNAATQSSTQETQFQKPITVVLSYADADLTNISEDNLNAFYLDEATGKWTCMNGTIDKVKKTVTFTTTHFSKYAILSSSIKTSQIKFTDLPANHWASTDIENMVKLGLVNGISPTQFAPERKITRAEFAALLVKALRITPTTQYSGRFKDVPADSWCFNVVNTAADAGLLSGYTPNTFGPNDPVSREQIAVMITRALSYKGINVEPGISTLGVFADSQNISSWAVNGVNTAVKQGIIKGRSTVQFAPLENATRAEAAVMILRMYNLL